MSRIEPIKSEELSEETRAILAEIEGAFGRVPNLFKTYTHFPPLLEANWNKIKAVMQQEGKLDPLTREIIAVAVSAVMGCEY